MIKQCSKTKLNFFETLLQVIPVRGPFETKNENMFSSPFQTVDQMMSTRTGLGSYPPNVAFGGGGRGGNASNESFNSDPRARSVNEEPSNTSQTLVSSLSVQPDADVMTHAKPGYPMFLRSPGDDLPTGTYHALTLQQLNKELEAKARVIKVPPRGGRVHIRDDELTDQFPSTINEFCQKITPFGLYSSHQKSSTPRTYYSNGHLSIGFGLESKSPRTANLWGASATGEVGFAAVLVKDMYSTFVGPDGSVLDTTPTAGEFLQVIPVYRSCGQLKAVLPFRGASDDLNIVTRRTLALSTIPVSGTATSFKYLDFSKPAEKSLTNFLIVPEECVAHYWKLGTILLTSNRYPTAHEIKMALRSYSHFNNLTQNCFVTLDLLAPYSHRARVV